MIHRHRITGAPCPGFLLTYQRWGDKPASALGGDKLWQDRNTLCAKPTAEGFCRTLRDGQRNSGPGRTRTYDQRIMRTMTAKFIMSTNVVSCEIAVS